MLLKIYNEVISVKEIQDSRGFPAQKAHQGRQPYEPGYPNIGVEPLPLYGRGWRGAGRLGHEAAPGAEALIRAGILADPHPVGTAAGTVEGIASRASHE
jgi:hypothetical protein